MGMTRKLREQRESQPEGMGISKAGDVLLRGYWYKRALNPARMGRRIAI